MNGRREDNPSSCYFHPEDDFIGVCPLCLHERLLILASRQKQLRRRRKDPGAHDRSRPSTNGSNPRPPINLPKIFALGSFLNRLEFKHYWRSDSVDLDREVSTSAEDDSFISIKFEDNGAASWEKKNTAVAAVAVADAVTTKSKVSLDNCNISWNHQSLNKVDPAKTTTTINNKSVIEHVKPRTGSLRWRKRIGHMFHLIRWKRSSKASVCHVGAKVEGVKVRNNGWIRTLTKRRAKE